MKTHGEIAHLALDTAPPTMQATTRPYYLETVAMLEGALETYRIELLREFGTPILEALAAIEESTAADSMQEVFDARDDAGDLLQRIHDVIAGVIRP